MVSIIVAIHNQLSVNKLFVESLKKYSAYPYELIILDNNSTDGSAEFYEKEGAIVIKNKANYNYPYCQNQGIKIAKYDFLAFLNNDIIVGPDWDKNIIETMKVNGLEVATSTGMEHLETDALTKKALRKWKAIKNPIAFFSTNIYCLRLMVFLMYGNLEKYNRTRFQQFGTNVVEGFCGNSVFMFKSAIEKVGLWDERIQGADFDLYLRTKKRSIEVGDIKPVHVALGVYNHHFIRLTLRSKQKPPVFEHADKMISIESKWGNDFIKQHINDAFQDYK